MSDLRELHHAPAVLVPDYVLLPEGPARDHAVVVEGNVIAATGPVEEVTRRFPAARRIDLPGRLLMPGFVDAHHHLSQSFGKSLVFGEPSEIFQRVWVPMESHMDADAVEVATRLAAWESLRGGFTTVADAGTRSAAGAEVIARTVDEVGIRCVLGSICDDLSQGSPVREVAEVRRSAEEHLNRWADTPLVHPSLALSIPDAASDAAVTAASQLSREAGVPLQIHLNEHLAGVERSLKASRERPLERLHRLDALGPELLAAHTTLLTPREIRLLRESGGAISYNPVASSWKGNAVAPALLLHELGVRVGLGTDGTRSDAFRLLDAAETAQRLTSGMASGDSSSGGGWTWLECGLRGGADAVGLSDAVGLIATGAQADLLVVDLEVPEFAPSWDLPWELVRLGNRDQIDAVIVSGRLRLENGWPVDWDGHALLAKAREVSQRVVTAAPITRVDPFSAEHRRRWFAEHPMCPRQGPPEDTTGRPS
ncbi:amidohydrolase family protein [Kocuria massiliensis]|uniref:amidohydrolase family protein n=1 Tax=Kocuria massiliensis TaxID=1926282 RepID=UPI0022B96726|nr:amidohydrolase family protein [Kocuria massiliensis]